MKQFKAALASRSFGGKNDGTPSHKCHFLELPDHIQSHIVSFITHDLRKLPLTCHQLRKICTLPRWYSKYTLILDPTLYNPSKRYLHFERGYRQKVVVYDPRAILTSTEISDNHKTIIPTNNNYNYNSNHNESNTDVVPCMPTLISLPWRSFATLDLFLQPKFDYTCLQDEILKLDTIDSVKSYNTKTTTKEKEKENENESIERKETGDSDETDDRQFKIIRNGLSESMIKLLYKIVPYFQSLEITATTRSIKPGNDIYFNEKYFSNDDVSNANNIYTVGVEEDEETVQEKAKGQKQKQKQKQKQERKKDEKKEVIHLSLNCNLVHSHFASTRTTTIVDAISNRNFIGNNKNNSNTKDSHDEKNRLESMCDTLIEEKDDSSLNANRNKFVNVIDDDELKQLDINEDNESGLMFPGLRVVFQSCFPCIEYLELNYISYLFECSWIEQILANLNCCVVLDLWKLSLVLCFGVFCCVGVIVIKFNFCLLFTVFGSFLLVCLVFFWFVLGVN